MEITAGVFAVCKVDIGDNVHDAAVCFFGQALVLTAVSGFHVEDRNMQSLCCNGRQTGVGVTENKKCIGLDLIHQLIGAVDNVAHRCTEIVAYCIHIDFGIGKLQILKENAIKVIIIVLTCVCKNCVKVRSALIDNSRKTDDFGTCANNNQQLQLAVILKFYIAVIKFYIHFHYSTTSKNVSGWFGSNCSFAHITVTRFSVSERLMIL